jgi:tetratricopeptide (TPR) repeat protein
MDGDQKQKGSRSRIANYQKILATNPRSFIFAQLAEEYLKLGDADKAIEICRKGLTFNPDFSDGLYVLGVAFFKKGMRDNARNIFFRILKKQPDHYLALEALRRMGFGLDQIQQSLDENDYDPGDMGADEELEGLDEALPEEAPSLPEPPVGAAPVAPAPVKRGPLATPNEIRSAYKPGVQLNDDETETTERAEMPGWLKIAIPALLAVLVVAAFIGYTFYQKHLEKQAIAQLVTESSVRFSHDTLDDYTKNIELLEKAHQEHPELRVLKALLVEVYARLLIDYDPGQLDWQRRMETYFAQFPSDNLNDLHMVRAQAFRSMSLNKLGDVTFMAETAAARGMKSAAIRTLEGDIFAIDRRFDEAIKAYDAALATDQRELRAMYRKALAQMAMHDYSSAKITLDLLLEQAPNHILGKIARWESMLYGNASVREVDQELEPVYNSLAQTLPVIPRARLMFLKAFIADRLGERARALDLVRESVSLHPRPEPLYLLAVIQFATKQIEQAKQNVQRAIAMLTEEKKYHALLGRIYFLEDNKTNALQEMELAIGDSGDDPDLLELAGDAASKLRMYDRAVDYYQRASLIKSQSEELKKKLVLTLIDKQDMKEAARRIEKLLTFNQDDPLTYFLNGRLLLSQDKAQDARKSFLKGLALEADNREIQLEIANLNVREGDIKNALATLRKLEKAYPKDVEVLELLADWSFAAASWQEARSLYMRLREIKPQAASYRLRLAYLDFQTGKTTEARQVVEEELARDANLGYGHILRGVFLFLDGDAKRAEAQIQKGIQLDSRNAEGHYWLGRIKLDGNDTTWAKNEFEITLECQAVFPTAVYEIGVIHFMKGQIEQARQRFVSALNTFALFGDTSAYQVKIYLRLGEIAVGRSRIAEAQKLFTQANKLDPNAAEPYYYLAREALDKFRNDRNSVGLLKKAIALDPEFAPAYFELGLVYMAKDRNREATTAFNDYLRLAPQGPYAAETRRYLAEIQ